MEKICFMMGAIRFIYPIMQVSRNGAYGAHWDSWDVAQTIWQSVGRSAIVFPTHEHIVYLQPGDTIRFDGSLWFHANMVAPNVETVIQSLQKEYCELQEVAQCSAAESSSLTSGRAWGAPVEPKNRKQLGSVSACSCLRSCLC